MRTFLLSLFQASVILGGLVVLGECQAIYGQERGRDESRDRGGDRGGSDRGGGDRGGDRGRGGFDPSEWYKRMDANGDGIIQPSEMSDRTRSFLERSKPPGIDLSQPIPISKLVDAFNAARAAEERSRSESSGSSSGGSGGSSSSGSGSTPAAPPGIRGFGGTPARPGPPGFNVPLSNSTKGSGSIEQRYSRQVIEYVDRMLADYDRNRDNVLDANEISQGRWQTDPRESDLNKDGKLDKNELLERIAKRLGNTGGGSSSGGGASGSSSSGGGGEEREKFKRYAESLVKQHDQNKNGVLERDEWSSVKSITKETDLNNDTVVTVDELTVKLTNDAKQASAPSGGGGASSSSSSGGSSSGGRGGPPGFGRSRSGQSGDGKTAEVRSYRQKSPLERLPKGLPDWFARNDADGDGQVVMAEYSTSWSESKAAEFAKFDLNGDGVVTPAECLKAQELEKGSSSTSSSSSSSSGGGFGRR